MRRCLGPLLPLLAVSVISACSDDDSGQDQTTCGNLVLEPGEDCDSQDDVLGLWGCRARMGCGNGVVDSGEECDDGNNLSGDGCSGTCLEEGSCGDGYVDGAEECDGDYPEHGVFCDDSCQLIRFCGDGWLDPGEECDDASTLDGDGCSGLCQLENPAPDCGNGILEQGEECDDGNTERWDPCHQCRRLQALYLTELAIAEAGVGWDQVDSSGAPGQWDCRVDNVVGGVSEYANALSVGITIGIQGGFSVLFALDDLDDPLGRDDPEITAYLFNADDVDNNLATSRLGGDYFHLRPEELTPAQEPTSVWSGSIQGSLLNMQSDRATLIVTVTSFTARFELAQLRLRGTLLNDGRRITGLTGAIMGASFTATSMSQYPEVYKEYFAVASGLNAIDYGTFLDMLVFGTIELDLGETMQPDVDLDGDGLEQFEDTNPDDGIAAIDRCIDGDGVEILGAGCVNDPRIQDGFSVTMTMEGIWARLDGFEPD